MPLRRAAFAWAKACRSSGIRIEVEADVLPPGPSCRATGPAIDTGAVYGKHKAAILRGIAVAYGFPAVVGIEHGAILNNYGRIVGCGWRSANPHLTFKAPQAAAPRLRQPRLDSLHPPRRSRKETAMFRLRHMGLLLVLA